jgi:urea transport system permease protein
VANHFGFIADYDVNRLGRYICLAIVALGIDLVWGYTGILPLCQAFFFCLGGYAIAMHLSLPQGGGQVLPEYNNIPQFFFFNNVNQLPTFWRPFASLPFALFVALALPGTFAFLFGGFVLKSGVRGVYFAIITQALAWAAFLAFCRNELLLGGTNGLTNFYNPLTSSSGWILSLYLLSAAALVVLLVLFQWLLNSNLGTKLVAVRDNESRLRSLKGYRPANYKIFVFTVGALTAAVGGILYVPQNGIITPNIMRVEDSVFLVICVAMGGRGTLLGPIFGSLAVNYANSTLTSDAPRLWPFVLAAFFLMAVLVPGGLSGLWVRLERSLATKPLPLLPWIAISAIVIFIGSEAVGWMPDALNSGVAGFPIKYLLFVSVILAGWVIDRITSQMRKHSERKVYL